MGNEYGHYLAKSEIYQNLKKAKDDVKLQIEKLEELKKSFANATGNNIDTIKEDISSLIVELTNYQTTIKDIWDKLDKNAKAMDDDVASLRAQIGTSSKKKTGEFSYEKDNIFTHDVGYEEYYQVNVDENGGYPTLITKRYLERFTRILPDGQFSMRTINKPNGTYIYKFNGIFEKIN